VICFAIWVLFFVQTNEFQDRLNSARDPAHTRRDAVERQNTVAWVFATATTPDEKCDCVYLYSDLWTQSPTKFDPPAQMQIFFGSPDKPACLALAQHPSLVPR